MKSLKLKIQHTHGTQEEEEILEGIRIFNRSQVPEPIDLKDLVVSFSNDEGKVVAGLVGCSGWRWMFVKFLWVDESLRGQGMGRQLLEAAEKESLKLKCESIYLDTFSFQAPGFYEKQGYSLFGTLDNGSPHFIVGR